MIFEVLSLGYKFVLTDPKLKVHLSEIPHINEHPEKYTYLLSCRELDEKIDTILTVCTVNMKLPPAAG